MIIQINQAQVNRVIERLDRFSKKITARDVLEQLAVMVKNVIRVRTASGKDVEGKPFAKYNKAYAKQHGKTLVDLTLTGKLMNSMTQKVISNNTAKVFFINTAYKSGINTVKLAGIHNEEGAGRSKVVRRFFGLADTDLDKLLKEYQSDIMKAKKEAGL